MEAVGVPLGNEVKGPQAPLYMDNPYMKKTRFLMGAYQDKYVFFFDLYDHLVGLPCPRLTKVALRSDITFAIEYRHQLGRRGTLIPVPDRRKTTTQQAIAGPSSSGAGPSSSSPALEIREEPTRYGPPRYYFQPYSGVIPKGPLHVAHEYIGKLEGWNRIQDKTIYKLKAKYKALKNSVKKNAQTSAKFMKKVDDVLVNAGIGGCRASDFDVAGSSAPKPCHRLSSDHEHRKRRNPSPAVESLKMNPHPWTLLMMRMRVMKQALIRL